MYKHNKDVKTSEREALTLHIPLTILLKVALKFLGLDNCFVLIIRLSNWALKNPLSYSGSLQ